jgi:hypothetical protein
LKSRALLGRIVVPGFSAAHFWLREQAAVEQNRLTAVACLIDFLLTY